MDERRDGTDAGVRGALGHLSDIVCDKCGKVLVEGVPDTPAICGQCLTEEITAPTAGSPPWREDFGWRGVAAPYDEKRRYTPPRHYQYWLAWHSADGASWVDGPFNNAPSALRAARVSRHRYCAWAEIYSVLAGTRPEQALRYYIERYAGVLKSPERREDVA